MDIKTYEETKRYLNSAWALVFDTQKEKDDAVEAHCKNRLIIETQYMLDTTQDMCEGIDFSEVD